MSAARHVIGLDLDNTLVDYDAVFAALAAEHGIPAHGGPVAKRLLRDAVRTQPGGEGRWTELQGAAYGPRMETARLFDGVRTAIEGWRRAGHRVVVISHKTRFAALGAPHDFHEHARRWIQRWLGDFELPVFLEPTRWAKLRRIANEGCTVFVDDLLDLLQEPAFPSAVQRVWFAPGHGESVPAGLVAVRTWSEIPAAVAAVPAREVAPAPAAGRTGPFTGDAVEFFDTFAARALGSRVVRCTRLPGGINNLGARLELADGRTVVGKIYKRSPADPRDRLDHETRFLRLLADAGIGNVPRVLAVDETAGAALHSLVPGERWSEERPAPAAVWEQFSGFLEALQRAARLPAARELPLASEAALSLQEHLAWVQERRDLWRGRALAGELDAPVADEILGPFEAAYQGLAAAAITHPEFSKRVAQDRLILSPSDFGLHNALVTADGEVSFVDFEYAGWDDPAKTDADFACQPRHGAGRPAQLAALDSHLNRADARPRLVRELLALKWRFIVLAAQHSCLVPPAAAPVLSR